MKQDQRRRLFSSALSEFMTRAGIGDTELARRIGVARLTVRRWREGNNLPNEETIRKLKSGLRWLDSTAAIHELTNEEVEQLLVTAGRQHLPVRQDVEAERATPTDRCIVYSARYSPMLFPSRWSARMVELERSVSGSLYMMWSTLPSITRPPAFYQGAYSRELFQRDKVEAYMAAHVNRQKQLVERLNVSEIHHLYSLSGIEDFLSGDSKGLRPPWDFWNVPKPILAEQFNNILTWLHEYENFEVRLRTTAIPGNVVIIGHDVVLVEFSRAWSTQTTDTVQGLEIIGAAAAVQFTRQFRSFWSDSQTIKDQQTVRRQLARLRDAYAT